MAQLYERLQPGPDVHDGLRRRYRVRCGIHRVPRCHRRATSVNIAINVIQISALLVFSIMALSYRMNHPPGSVALNYDAQTTAAYPCEFATEKQTVNGQQTDVVSRDATGNPKPKLDAAGKPVAFQIAYPEKDEKGNFQSHPTAGSVVSIHNFGWMFVQATVAILILVGFESVTSMEGRPRTPSAIFR